MEQLLLKQKQVMEFNNVKRIGVIADTHGNPIPEKAFELFKTADLILIAGDIEDLETLKELEKLARIVAVYGNMDSDEIREKLPRKVIIKINNLKIGLTHGDGPPAGLVSYTKRQFNEKLDCIVFGHSHNPFNEVVDGTLFFNPGSATDTVFALFNSIGILIVDNKIEGKIIKL